MAAPPVVAGAGQDERRVAQPGVDAQRQRIGMPGDAAGARMGAHPVVDEGAGQNRAIDRAIGRASGVAEVGQPFEVMEGETPEERLARGPPVDRPGEGEVAPDEADAAVQDAPSVGHVARPRVGGGQP